MIDFVYLVYTYDEKGHEQHKSYIPDKDGGFSKAMKDRIEGARLVQAFYKAYHQDRVSTSAIKVFKCPIGAEVALNGE